MATAMTEGFPNGRSLSAPTGSMGDASENVGAITDRPPGSAGFQFVHSAPYSLRILIALGIDLAMHNRPPFAQIASPGESWQKSLIFA